MWAGLVLWTSYSTSMCLYHPFDIMYRISLVFYWCVIVCASHITHKKYKKHVFSILRVLVFPQPDSSFPPLLLVFFSWRRTGHTHITHSRGPPIWEDWRRTCFPPLPWTRSASPTTPPSGQRPFSAAAQLKAAPPTATPIADTCPCCQATPELGILY